MLQTRGWKCRFTSIEKACGYFSIIILLGSKGEKNSFCQRESIDASSSDVNRAAVNGGGALAACVPTEKNWRQILLAVLEWSAVVLVQKMTMQPVVYKF